MIREIRKRMTSQRGFTLVELMVVIAIIGVLAAIAIPKFSATTATAKDAKLEADLRTTDSVLMMYYADKKVYPDALDTVKTYFSSGAVPTDAKGAALKYILNGDKSAYKLSGVKSNDDSTVYSPGSDKTIPDPK